eukprot:COSAG02_NODE_898_length_16108_cov_5.877444_4_plen_155_part_00
MQPSCTRLVLATIGVLVAAPLGATQANRRYPPHCPKDHPAPPPPTRPYESLTLVRELTKGRGTQRLGGDGRHSKLAKVGIRCESQRSLACLPIVTKNTLLIVFRCSHLMYCVCFRTTMEMFAVRISWHHRRLNTENHRTAGWFGERRHKAPHVG